MNMVRPLFWILVLSIFVPVSPASAKDFKTRSELAVFPDWFKQSFWDLKDDAAEARKAGKTGIMIYISAENCSYCAAFIERSLGDPIIQKRVRRQFDVLGLEVVGDTRITDVDGKVRHVKDFTKKYKAYVTPTMLFFDGNGKLLLKIVGYYPPDKFARVLDYFDQEHFRRQSWRQYYADTQKQPHGGSIIRNPKLFPQKETALDRSRGNTGRPLLVLFEKPGCDPCKELHRKTLTAKETQNLISRFDSVQIDASNNTTILTTPGGERLTARRWAEKLDLVWYPAFIFFDESGKEIFRIDTYTRNTRLNGSMRLVLSKDYLDEPQLQRWNRQQFVKKLKQDH